LALAQAALEQELITELAPASVIDINLQAEQAFITVQHAEQIQKITASIVLACDGTQSHWREQFALQTETLAAKQHAIIANVETSKPHLDCAYERFTELGTLALLPLKNKRMTSVLSVDQERYQALQQYSDADYLTLLQQQFGKRLGELCGLGKRFSYPLQSVHCRDMQRDRFLLLGNAVHTINPIAAQGLNLALRDIAVLIDCLQAEGLHVQALSTYVEKVLPAHEKMRKFTDNLVRVAKHKYLRHARSIGLLALDVAPMAKYSLANTLAGFSEHRGKKLQAVQDVL
jgi:2-polyprenyl-6-methoxyphenol hydroxylase-like FAD-dependent oxidoreductase